MVASVALGENSTRSHHAVKLLDLLTNRYHVGVVESAWDQGLRIQLPASTRFQAGQRVRFFVSTGETLVAKNAMRRALISDVDAGFADRTSIELAVIPESHD